MCIFKEGTCNKVCSKPRQKSTVFKSQTLGWYTHRLWFKAFRSCWKQKPCYSHSGSQNIVLKSFRVEPPKAWNFWLSGRLVLVWDMFAQKIRVQEQWRTTLGCDYLLFVDFNVWCVGFYLVGNYPSSSLVHNQWVDMTTMVEGSWNWHVDEFYYIYVCDMRCTYNYLYIYISFMYMPDYIFLRNGTIINYVRPWLPSYTLVCLIHLT